MATLITRFTPGNEKLYDRAAALALITILYNIVEGLVSVMFGMKDESMSLFGFGLDSFVTVWPFPAGNKEAPEIAENGAVITRRDRIVGPRLFETLDNSPGKRADIGAAVASDFSLIPDTSQRNAHELAPQRARN